MDSLLPLLLLAVGFVALILGANWLVNGATSVGIRAKLSPLIIGLTIVAFGTSLPEMIVNIFSCAKGSPGLAIGNIIGSNTMNILLILGVSSLIWPIDVSRVSIRRDIPAGFVATLQRLLHWLCPHHQLDGGHRTAAGGLRLPAPHHAEKRPERGN